MTRIGVVGHIEWVDFVPVRRFPRRGEVVHADGAFARAGGGGGVVASVLAGLGAEVDFFCALGNDAAGRAAAAQLGERGVKIHVAWRTEPTRRAVTLLEPDGERTIITLGERLEPHGSDELDWALLRGTRGVYFTSGDAGALRHARRAPLVVASPRGWHALEGTALDALVFSTTDERENAWANRLASDTAMLVATEGAAGGRWWGKSKGRWEPAPLPGAPRDAYGCGDSFAAGFTLALARGDSVEQAAALGARCGARCRTLIGPP
jgi:ribokinase